MQTADAELARRLRVFQAWHGTLRDHLSAQGFWCDAVDPRTGQALHSAPAGRYSEAIGAQIFRGYPVVMHRLCSAVQHPEHGVHTYPATTFTTAPLVNVHSALAAACVIDASPLSSWMSRPPSPDAALLTVQNATVALPCGAAQADGMPRRLCVAEAVSFELVRGQRMLICGAPGVGKSVFLLALHGLMPLAQGSVQWAANVRAMHVPQEPVQLPGATLCEQLMYPEEGSCDVATAEQLLAAVGLSYLWHRSSSNGAISMTNGVNGVQAHGPGDLNLSRGELQCLAVARVLRAQPDVVLLDEAFSAVPAGTEAALLDTLERSGITVVMVSHREQSGQGDVTVLRFSTDVQQGWTIE